MSGFVSRRTRAPSPRSRTAPSSHTLRSSSRTPAGRPSTRRSRTACHSSAYAMGATSPTTQLASSRPAPRCEGPEERLTREAPQGDHPSARGSRAQARCAGDGGRARPQRRRSRGRRDGRAPRRGACGRAHRTAAAPWRSASRIARAAAARARRKDPRASDRAAAPVRAAGRPVAGPARLLTGARKPTPRRSSSASI